MQTIVIASGKVGAGKATVTAHLAVEAGPGAWVVDTDKQATLTQWHERREALLEREPSQRVGAGA
jgi:chromosome partitioning protein